MFGKKKADRPKRDHSGKNLSQYGLFDMTNDGGMDMDDEGNDSDLEAELAALSGGGGAKPKRPQRKKALPQTDLNAMVAQSIRDIPSDEELSGDDDDPDLLNELQDLAGGEVNLEEATPEVSPEYAKPALSDSVSVLSILEARLKMYEEAEASAKEAGEISKARRYGRALKTIKDLTKQAKAGSPVNNDDIPPEVHFSVRKPIPAEGDETSPATSPIDSNPPLAHVEPSPEATEPPVPQITKEINTELLELLNDRKLQYKKAALNAKKTGDAQTAMKYIKTAKQFDSVIAAVEAGQPVDLSKMPGPPGEAAAEAVEENRVQRQSPPDIPGVDEAAAEPLPEPTLIVASSVLEALEQRLAVYKEQENKAKQEENSGKARRYGRIVKQFETAIKQHKAGKPVEYEELPTPPGYGPIPVGGAAATPKSSPPAVTPTKPAVSPSPTGVARQSGNHVATSRAEKQVAILLAKQKQFKEAALKAKQKGEIPQAKEYLRQAKGFDKLLEAARAGLPVDFSSIPVSPEAKSQLDNEYDIVMSGECNDDDSGDVDMMTRLETQLSKQLKMCLSTRDHHKALGDVAGTNRFERLALNVTKDLDIVRLSRRTPGSKVPKFHYETKDFSIVKSFTELTDNDLELLIVRGINYSSENPKDIDTYVKFTFPFPQETPYYDLTATVKDTNNPDYNATFTIPIQRTSRACQRVFKRHAIKFEVYSKSCCAGIMCECFSGWFRSDTLLGTVNVKLQPLETQCELHESFDLLEGRKKVGGKLEVRLRLRHPIVTQQVEQLHEKWLVIDQ
ncbi:unnamed protein product [Brassicogethes aeneus]|uniref:C2 domain-containing protein n=1 Tax=Brassicogethes aeneus TaxID=1431903 RepID=A0A9P0B8X9_BRAAE|nr:unnamed protein product [Brassicogethes aeneus]